jgi:hypothetical protein
MKKSVSISYFVAFMIFALIMIVHVGKVEEHSSNIVVVRERSEPVLVKAETFIDSVNVTVKAELYAKEQIKYTILDCSVVQFSKVKVLTVSGAWSDANLEDNHPQFAGGVVRFVIGLVDYSCGIGTVQEPFAVGVWVSNDYKRCRTTWGPQVGNSARKLFNRFTG